MRKLAALILLAVTALNGCAVNPVTGESELAFVSEAQELSIGKEQYGPSRQMQGGVYLVDPEVGRYVAEVGQRLAEVSDRALPYEFAVVNNSAPNAWALPGGKIAISRGLLLELDSEAELAAVLGHEIVHAAARHGAKSMERGLLLQGAVLAAGAAAGNSDYGDLVVGGASLAAGLLNQKYGRNAELESDRFGMTYMSRAGYDPEGAVKLQETFVRLSEGRPANWLSGLFASHPPSRERVAANRATVQTLPAGGARGKARHQRKIAHLHKTKAAYDALNKGREALAEGDAGTALKLARQALRIEPREAAFHALRGDARFAQRRYQDALGGYNRALDRDDDFYYFYLQRGLTRNKLRDRRGALQDLETSVRLLPTAVAYNALGDIAQASGDRAQAIQYFRAAAGSKSVAGRQALASLVRLDLPSNPGDYVKLRTGLDRRGYLVVQVSNTSPLPIHRVRVLFRYPDAQGRMRQSSRTVRGAVGAGKSVQLRLGPGPYADTAVLRVTQVGVDRAAVAE